MSTDYNTRAAKGQALNLAVHDAIAAGEAENKNYVFTKYVYYFKLSQMVQTLEVEDIEKELRR